jgi:hypothetical protein
MELMVGLVALEVHQVFLEHPLTMLVAVAGLPTLLAQAQLAALEEMAAAGQALMLLVLMPLHLVQQTLAAAVVAKARRLLLPGQAAQA